MGNSRCHFALLVVPCLKTVFDIPPYLGMIFVLALLWAMADIIHPLTSPLRFSKLLAKLDLGVPLFFFGVLLTVDALSAAGLFAEAAAYWTQAPQGLFALLIGLLSALVDNVPLVAAAIEIYPLAAYPVDSPLWQMLAYAAGTGGSILLIGSSAGVALMGLEKVTFAAYARAISLPALAGYLAGMAVCWAIC